MWRIFAMPYRSRTFQAGRTRQHVSDNESNITWRTDAKTRRPVVLRKRRRELPKMSVPYPNDLEIPALRVAQWLDEWNKVEYEPKLRRRKPDGYFYLFTLPAPRLKALTGVYRRTTEAGARRSDELGIQRRHDRMRSEE